MAATIAPLALLATSCGDKHVDPYLHSLRTGSEHVELHGSFSRGSTRYTITGSGDFTNAPDRGRLHVSGKGPGASSFDEVYAGRRIYTNVDGTWVSGKVHGTTPQTPAEMFRAHLPAQVENGLVRRITVTSMGGSVTYLFSKYGEHVSVTIPRVKGFK